MSGTDTGHLKGCSFGRTSRCNCTYLAQWDRTPEFTAATFTRSPELQELHDAAALFKHPGTLVPRKPLPTEEDIIAEIDALHSELTDGDAAEVSAHGSRDRCEFHPYAWHYPDKTSCEEFNERLLGGAGFTELDEHPDAMVQLAGKIATRLVGDARQETGDERLRTKYWYKEYQDLHRRYGWLLGFALAGWALGLARGIWGF